MLPFFASVGASIFGRGGGDSSQVIILDDPVDYTIPIILATAVGLFLYLRK